MTATLTPKQLADAAAQGVAIALNARNQETATAHAKVQFTPVHLTCGGPLEMFNVTLKLNEQGIVAPGLAVQVQKG